MNDGKSEREKRLAEALRTNLRRRKGQAREQAQSDRDQAADREILAHDAASEDGPQSPE